MHQTTLFVILLLFHSMVYSKKLRGDVVFGKISLRSWKGDYLHRPDTNQGVTTWNTGIGNQWEVEVDLSIIFMYRNLGK